MAVKISARFSLPVEERGFPDLEMTFQGLNIQARENKSTKYQYDKPVFRQSYDESPG